MNLLLHAHRIASATLAVVIVALCTSTGAVAADRPTAIPPTAAGPSLAGQREGPQFYSGAVIDVSGVIDGDVYATGQSVTISGSVTGDVIAAAQTINVTGTVDGDVRLAAQSVTISGQITRSATIAASDITLTDSGSFGDDVVGAASTINISGAVTRDLLLGVDRLTITGPVGGRVTYSSNNEADIAEGAVIGTVQRIDTPESDAVEVSPWAAFLGWLRGLLYALVALSLITLLAGLLIPRWLHQVTGHLLPTPWKALLVGAVAAITVPIALLIALVTFIGAPLALTGLLLWAVLSLASFVYGAYYLGRLVLRGTARPLVRSLIGGVILIIALQIPWLNLLVWFAMVSIGLGAQLLELRRQRPWKLTTEPTAGPAQKDTAIAPPEPTPTPV